MTQAQDDQLRILAAPNVEISEILRKSADVGPETFGGRTEHFTLFYANSLGTNGAALADAVLLSCEQNYVSLRELFGGITPAGLPFEVHILPGSFGAFHHDCTGTKLICGAFTGNDGILADMLVVAEADEVFMANQKRGWDCGASNGEALSRVIADALTGRNFSTAIFWLDSERKNFVNQNDKSDAHFDSIGCAVLFINYLRFQLGFNLAQIVQDGGPTLARTSVNLGGSSYPFEPFALLLEVNFPPGTPVNVNLDHDNPFPLTMSTVPLSGLVHLQNIGDVGFVNDEFAGTQGQSRRLEGFQIQFDPPVAGLGMRYMAHLQDIGDVPWVNAGQFIGTRGQSRRLEGFAIELTGPAAANYSVLYMAHLQGLGDTGFFRDGQFCGTRGQSRRVEGMLVHVGPR